MATGWHVGGEPQGRPFGSQSGPVGAPMAPKLLFKFHGPVQRSPTETAAHGFWAASEGFQAAPGRPWAGF
eukprot:6689636-Pyramimonas_sp.AAC.1